MRLIRVVPTSILGSRAFGAVGKRFLPPADLALQRLTRGRASVAAATGLPLLVLETTGRRTGQKRVTPLVYATQGTDFFVVGSNFGQEHQPAWALNLEATPEATVDLHGERSPVRARILSAEERAQVWPLLLEVWPAFDTYVERVRSTSDREIMVFRLERT
jgi:deazaflavin-dependent oxidoreductase (nitroreductase family)